MDRPTIELTDLEILEIISWGRVRKETGMIISQDLMRKLVQWLGLTELKKLK